MANICTMPMRGLCKEMLNTSFKSKSGLGHGASRDCARTTLNLARNYCAFYAKEQLTQSFNIKKKNNCPYKAFEPAKQWNASYRNKTTAIRTKDTTNSQTGMCPMT